MGNSFSNPFSSPEGASGCCRESLLQNAAAASLTVILSHPDKVHSAPWLSLRGALYFQSGIKPWLKVSGLSSAGRGRQEQNKGDFPLASRDLCCAMKEDRRKLHKTSSCLALSQPRAACKLQATGEQLMSSPQPPFPGSYISITITAPEAVKRIQALKNKLEFNREINSVANCNAQRAGCVSVSSDSCTCSLGTV